MVQWAENRDEIIDTYPQHFAVETEAEAQFMKDYFENTFDWFVESPDLTEEWIEGEEPVFDLVQEAGVVPADAVTALTTSRVQIAWDAEELAAADPFEPLEG